MIDNPGFYDIEAEKAILGSVLVDNSCIYDIQSQLKPSDFYEASNAMLWSIFVGKAEKRWPIDIISVIDSIKSEGFGIDQQYVYGISNSVFSSANVDYYVRIVKDKAVKRELWRINATSAEDLVQGNKPGIEIANDLEQKAGDIATSNQVGSYVKIGTVLPQTINKIKFYQEHPDELLGLPSGFKSIDNILGGIRDEDYVILGARPSVGKSAMMQSMFDSLAIDLNIPVGVFSCEMSKESINERQVFSRSGITKRRIKMGHLRPDQYGRIEEACTKIHQAPIYIDDTPNIPLSLFRSSARKMIRNEGVKIIFIDYLTLIDSEKPSLKGWEQVSHISRQLKCFCRETHVPIVALSQLKREAQGKRPNLADLRESGAIEQDADIIFFLHREKEPEINAEIIETELICAKQRNGPVGTIKLNFYPELVKFEDAETT